MVKKEMEYYTSPTSMEPLFPEDHSYELESLAIELIEKAAKLSGTTNSITRLAIAAFLRPMNSYYSNLIEGHDTHPIDISKALNNDYSDNKKKKDLQLEARAHINVHKSISDEFSSIENRQIPSSEKFLKHIHNEFYKHLPEEFIKVKSKDNIEKEVIPGEFRDCEVEVGRHIAPYSDNLEAFMQRFQDYYDPTSNSNRSKIRRIISIAASHHRLAWIHPFLDGNGRVVRLYSDAFFIYEDIHASGLWSISRGLARTKEIYHASLSNADLTRQGNYDGRGNLSNKMLIEFCVYFLKTAIDQVEYMYNMIDTETMISRIERFVDLMEIKKILSSGARYILTDVFLKGKISKADAMRLTKTSDKTVKVLIDKLISLGLITPKMEGSVMMYYVNYPIKFSPLLFPGLYPSQKEMDMIDYKS